MKNKTQNKKRAKIRFSLNLISISTVFAHFLAGINGFNHLLQPLVWIYILTLSYYVSERHLIRKKSDKHLGELWVLFWITFPFISYFLNLIYPLLNINTDSAITVAGVVVGLYGIPRASKLYQKFLKKFF